MCLLVFPFGAPCSTIEQYGYALARHFLDRHTHLTVALHTYMPLRWSVAVSYGAVSNSFFFLCVPCVVCCVPRVPCAV